MKSKIVTYPPMGKTAPCEYIEIQVALTPRHVLKLPTFIQQRRGNLYV